MVVDNAVEPNPSYCVWIDPAVTQVSQHFCVPLLCSTQVQVKENRYRYIIYSVIELCRLTHDNDDEGTSN